MKKILVMLFVMALCIAMLIGYDSNTGDTDVIGSSDIVAENTEGSAEDTSMNGETETADSEVIDSLEVVMLNENDKVYASEFDKYIYAASEMNSNMEINAKEYANNTPISSGEKVVVSFSKFIYNIDREYNPYNDYLNINS